jgi:GntR family transcriptional regulator of arabinose operon
MVDILMDAIRDGTYPEGGKIPSENELSTAYGVSRNTVREAVSALVQQGYVSRAQGKGTFVISRQPQSSEATHAYAIFLKAHSHVFDVETRALVRAFQRQKALPIVFDVEDIANDAQAEAIFRKLLEQRVDGLVVDSRYMEHLERVCRASGHKRPPVAIVNFSEVSSTSPAKRVFSDFRAGAALATRHLIGLGRRRILFLTHRFHFVAADTPLEAIPGVYGETVRGYADAMNEAGLADAKSYFLIEREFAPGSGERERLHELLASPNRPDAILAFGDFRAKHALAVAEDAGLRVPEDLSLVGYWNTPWAEMSRVPLTSVSIREDEIARIAAEQLMRAFKDGMCEDELTVVQPTLVVRASCGAKS